MDANKILHADMLDIIFEGRNKTYGAYELRKSYNRRIIISVSVMVIACLLLFLTSIFGSDSDKDKNKILVDDVNLEDLRKEQQKTPELPPPPPPKRETPKIQIKQFTPPIIVDNDDVKEPPPLQDDLDDSKIGTVNQDGIKDDNYVAPPIEKTISGVLTEPQPKEEDYDRTFYKVEKEARFPGGPEAWRKYLQRNLNANAAQEDGAPVGNYTVRVQFIVDKEGFISNVTAIESPKACPSCAKEAVKIIQKGGRWEAAVQNGRKVIYQAVQHITFQVAEE